MGPWDPTAFAKLEEWDPAWAGICVKMTASPWISGILRPKLVELICVALNAACTTVDPEAMRRHIRAALDAGATRDEVLMTLKMASVLAIHSCSLGAPMLVAEAKAAGAKSSRPTCTEPTPATDAMKRVGQWNTAWNPFVELDPTWTDQFMATGAAIYTSGVFTPKEVELLSIALDANITHMYAPGTLRHIKTALAVGASVDEIMEVLKLCVVNGVQACNLGVPILAEELAKTKVAG
jgi:alkylhydroperoxidase/carboxymuconolactone decarboxylase family protein YurZ